MFWNRYIEMDRGENILNILIGIFAALLIGELIYQQPFYESQITSGGFPVVTEDGEYLGHALSTIYVKYNPNTWGTSLGEFSFPVKTQIAEVKGKTRSVLLKDVVYEISIRWRGRLIERKDSRYLGPLNVEEETGALFNVLFLPRTEHPMLELKRVYGLVKIEVTGRFYNKTSGEIISLGQTQVPIFILYPYVRLTTFSILFLMIFLKIYHVRKVLP